MIYLRINLSIHFVYSDFAEPLTLPSMIDPGPSTSDNPVGATPLGSSPPEESIAILTSMGFPRKHSIRALKSTVSRSLTNSMFSCCIPIIQVFPLAGTETFFQAFVIQFLPPDES